MNELLLTGSGPTTNGGSTLPGPRQDDATEQQDPTLEIHIHGSDGSLTTFTQNDPATVRRIVQACQRPDFLWPSTGPLGARVFVHFCEHSGPDQPNAETTLLPTETIIAAMQERTPHSYHAHLHWGIND